MRKQLTAGVLALIALFMYGCSTQHDESTPTTPSSDAVFSPVFSIAAPMAVGDYVWDDANENGIQDDGEKGMAGVTVHLTECAGPHNILATTVTDAGGMYEFLAGPGDYHVIFEFPSGYRATVRNAGSDDEIDSDCDTNGETVCFTMGNKPEINWDCGLRPSKKVPIGCRMTGGGVDIDGNWDGTLQEAKHLRNRYQFGGQAGANTALQPQPKGEWTHHQQRGPAGRFTFHGGTASAPEVTEIDLIVCSDPGFCNPARPAPAHQLDFWGIGTFKNLDTDLAIINSNVVVGQSLHMFEVNVDDSGEPGKGKKGFRDCPDQGFGLHGGEELVNCDCPDFYRITIYADQTDAQVIYQVYGYFNGNLQIHPLTGFDGNAVSDDEDLSLPDLSRN